MTNSAHAENVGETLSGGIAIGPFPTGNVPPILNEVRHALAKLLDTGEETAIDLRRIPLATREEEELEQTLGIGEVRGSIDALGPSEFIETAFPGVWLVVHRGPDHAVIGKYIEVAPIPSMLKADPSDMRTGLKGLGRLLDVPAVDRLPETEEQV